MSFSTPMCVSNKAVLKEAVLKMRCGGAMCRGLAESLFMGVCKAKSLDQSIKVLLVAGAQERTRTSTVLPPPGPEPGASTNFATWASLRRQHYKG